MHNYIQDAYALFPERERERELSSISLSLSLSLSISLDEGKSQLILRPPIHQRERDTGRPVKADVSCRRLVRYFTGQFQGFPNPSHAIS